MPPERTLDQFVSIDRCAPAQREAFQEVGMKRLLTTVAFSALVLGVAGSGWAQSTTQGTMGSTGKSTTSDAAGQPTRNSDAKAPMTSNKSTSSSQGAASSSKSMSSSQSGSATMSGSSSTDQTTAATAKPKRKSTSQRSSSSSSSTDRSAYELNRQELPKSGAASTGYG